MKKKIWDLCAPIYKKAMKSQARVYEKIYFNIERLAKDKEILELASGPGSLARKLAPLAKRIVATDYSEGMIREAKKKNCPKNLSFELADAKNLSYVDKSFDLVIIANALHIMTNPSKALEEISRVLKDDGILIAPNFINKNSSSSKLWTNFLKFLGFSFENEWTQEEYKNFLEINGWKIKYLENIEGRVSLLYVECIKNN